jgi:hypothetical protein
MPVVDGLAKFSLFPASGGPCRCRWKDVDIVSLNSFADACQLKNGDQ